MSKAHNLKKFKDRILLNKGSPEEILNKIIEGERDLYYMIEKITHQKVDDEYYAMKVEMFKEALDKDPEFKIQDDKPSNTKIGFK
jgi:uncharacterized membrane protein